MSVMSSSTVVEEEEKLLETYQEEPVGSLRPRPTNSWQQRIKHRLPWLLHLTVVLSYAIVILKNGISSKECSLLQPTEIRMFLNSNPRFIQVR